MMLEQIEGNGPLKQSLAAMLKGNRLAHSVLLVGQKGCGAGFAARCVAADFLYPAGGPAAQAVLKGAGAEVLALRPEGKMNQISVAAVRAMRQQVFSTALSAQGRAVIVYGADRLNEASANAMLKVMEEPPENVLFLLTAEGLAGVLPTIQSRCIVLEVSPLPVERCAALAAQRGVAPEDAALFSAVLDGRLGSVLAAARDAGRRKQLETARELCRAAAGGDAYRAMQLLVAYEKDRLAARQLLQDFSALVAAGLGQPGLSGLAAARALPALQAAQAAAEALAGNGNGKLVLALFAARLAGGTAGPAA